MEFSKYATNIQYWKDDIDLVMFVDENNSGILEYVKKANTKGKQISEADKYFVVTACIIEREQYEVLKSEFEALKYGLWDNAIYFNEKQQKNCKICFHSNEIRRRINAFQPKLVKHEILCEKINRIISQLDFKIISVAIDTTKYIDKFDTVDIYNIAMDTLIHNFIIFMKPKQKGIIMLEARGKKEDNLLYQHMKTCILTTGITEHTNCELMQHIKGVYFNGKYNDEKNVTYSGLELADLCSYPIYKYIKNNEKDIAFKTIESKIIGYPMQEEKGIIRIP